VDAVSSGMDFHAILKADTSALVGRKKKRNPKPKEDSAVSNPAAVYSAMLEGTVAGFPVASPSY